MDNISIIKNHAEVVDTTSLSKVYELIKSSESPHRENIVEIRRLYQIGSSEEADKLKKCLWGFTCSGIFKKRRVTKALESYSGMLMLDLDDLSPIRLKEVRHIIEFLPYTYMCFISPSGFGLKVIVKVGTSAEHHKSAYEQVKKYYEEETGEKFDKTCDVARLTYISYDPTAFFNETSIVFPFDLSKAKAPVMQMSTNGNSEWTEKELQRCFKLAVDFTEKVNTFEEGNRNNFVFQLACNANRYGIPVEYMLDACVEKYGDGWDEQEIRTNISGAYNRNADQAGSWKGYLSKGYKSSSAEQGERLEKRVQREAQDTEAVENTPVFPESIINGMPDIIRDIAIMLASDRERDTFITGALSVLSGCLYSVEGVYDGSIVFPNLYSFIIAPASSGKGVLKIARQLGEHLHEKLLKESEDAKAEYERALEEYKEAKRNGDKNVEKPEKPPFVMLFVAGNSSSASIYDHLNHCGGLGIVCETEADTVNTCFKNDWGNYSDMLRKAFHHEVISSRRKTDNQYIEVREPKLSVAISGTGSQVQSLIKSAEDGLFSRFIFYRFHNSRKWRDVSPRNGKVLLPRLIKKKSEELTKMVEYLIRYPSAFDLTEHQWDRLNKQFEKWLNDVSCFVTEEAGATVMRLGLSAFRISMILSAIRKYELASKDVKLICIDDHFNMALDLVNTYLQHAMVMYKELPAATRVLDGKLRKFFELLPMEFTRDLAKKLAMEAGLNVSDSWVDKWLKRLVTYGFLVKPDYNIYRKIQNNEKEKEAVEDMNISSITPVVSLPESHDKMVA
jgi:hypothetical protein